MRLIINNRSTLNDSAVLGLIQEIVNKGKISDGGNCYCYLNRAKMTVHPPMYIMTSCKKTKIGFSFTVWND